MSQRTNLDGGEGMHEPVSQYTSNSRSTGDGSATDSQNPGPKPDQSMDGNSPVVNTVEFINVLQTTFQQMQDRFTQMMDSVMERMDEMADRLNELEKEVTDLVSYAGGISETGGNKDAENIPPNTDPSPPM